MQARGLQVIKMDAKANAEFRTASTKFLASMGIKEIRFWNGQLRREKQYVRDVIFNALQARAPHPLPAYTRTGIVGGKKS